MRKTSLILAAAATLLAGGAAFAQQKYPGTVSRANPSTGEVTLTTGKTFRVSQPVLLQGLMPGTHVVITVAANGTTGIRQNDSYRDEAMSEQQ